MFRLICLARSRQPEILASHHALKHFMPAGMKCFKGASHNNALEYAGMCYLRTTTRYMTTNRAL